MLRQGKFCIWIASPADGGPPRYYDEVALALREAFAELGYDAPIVTEVRQITARPVILGAIFLTALELPAHCEPIIFNLEQVYEGSRWFRGDYPELLRRHQVWDYCENNVGELRRIGVEAAICRIGYTPGLTRFAPSREPDIDVLFIGTFAERRREVLRALHQRGIKVVAASRDCFGAERDALLARARIVLNMHLYDARVFEIVRVSYLLANRVCVVSETGADEALEAPFREGVAFTAYDGLIETCERLLADDAERQRLSQRGFEIFSRMRQAPLLAQALERTAGAHG